MTKISKQGPEYSGDREWHVILEDLRSQFRVFGEGLQIMNGRFDRMEGRLDRIENRCYYSQK